MLSVLLFKPLSIILYYLSSILAFVPVKLYNYQPIESETPIKNIFTPTFKYKHVQSFLFIKENPKDITSFPFKD